MKNKIEHVMIDRQNDQTSATFFWEAAIGVLKFLMIILI